MSASLREQLAGTNFWRTFYFQVARLRTSRWVLTGICGLETPACSKRDSVENMWALSVKFILPLARFLCNDMQEPSVMLGTHVSWICYQSHGLCDGEVQRFVFLMVCAPFSSVPSEIVCKLKFDWFLFSALWIFSLALVSILFFNMWLSIYFPTNIYLTENRHAWSMMCTWLLSFIFPSALMWARDSLSIILKLFGLFFKGLM